MVSRIYVEKKPGFDVESQQLAHELRHTLGIRGLRGLRIINRYDVEGITRELFERCVPTVFSEPQSDVATTRRPAAGAGAGRLDNAVEGRAGFAPPRARTRGILTMRSRTARGSPLRGRGRGPATGGPAAQKGGWRALLTPPLAVPHPEVAQ